LNVEVEKMETGKVGKLSWHDTLLVTTMIALLLSALLVQLFGAAYGMADLGALLMVIAAVVLVLVLLQAMDFSSPRG
jgi:energy-converting hydrogenase Eha subunit A